MSLLQNLRLRTEIGLWRYGWLWAVALLALLLAIILHAWWLPQQNAHITLLGERLSALEYEQKQRRQAPKPTVTVNEDAQTVEQLARIAYSSTEVSTTLQLIQRIAKAKGIVLAQSEFQNNTENLGGFKQIQITLPVRCSYPQLRDFTSALLRQLPGISLDQISLKRDNIAQSQADVRLKLTIWVHPNKTIAPQKPSNNQQQTRDLRKAAS